MRKMSATQMRRTICDGAQTPAPYHLRDRPSSSQDTSSWSGGSRCGNSWRVPEIGTLPLGQHSGLDERTKHSRACDFVYGKAFLRVRERQREPRVLEKVILDSHYEVFESAPCRSHRSSSINACISHQRVHLECVKSN